MAETPQKHQTINVGTRSPATLLLKDSDVEVAITLDVTHKTLRTIYAIKSENESMTKLLNEDVNYIRLVKSHCLKARLYSEGSRIPREYSKKRVISKTNIIRKLEKNCNIEK